jgi:hypothetical protein
MSKKKQEQNTKNLENPEYNKILDNLIEMIGGKEYCLRQLLFEGDHKKFISEYKIKNRDFIINQIPKFYDSMPYDEKNIVDIEISSSVWNKYVLKIFYYDELNHRFFEFSIKTNRVEEVSLFELSDDCDDDSKNYSRSFYSKVKGGNLLWEKYNKLLENKKMEEYAEKLQKEKIMFAEKMKKFNFISTKNKNSDKDNNEISEELKNLNLIEAPDQYKDGKTRYISDNKFYYLLVGIDGYITFDESVDIMLEPYFARLFYEKIVKKLRE